MKQKNTLNKKSVIKAIELHKAELQKFGAKKIGLFGSFAKGAHNKKSDLDFLVAFREKSLDNYMDLKFFLEK